MFLGQFVYENVKHFPRLYSTCVWPHACTHVCTAAGNGHNHALFFGGNKEGTYIIIETGYTISTCIQIYVNRSIKIRRGKLDFKFVYKIPLIISDCMSARYQ